LILRKYVHMKANWREVPARKAMMGSGEAAGDDRAIRATEQAIHNPLLDDALQGAQGLIISISGGEDLRLMEVDEVANHL
jgi:cell division protein FtsZ